METRWVVGPDYRGRLDLFLASVVAGKSRHAVQKALSIHPATVNGRSARPSQIVSEGDEILFTLPEAVPCALLPEDIPLDIVYEDRDLLVINKPRGMVVHPAPGNRNGTLVNALLHHCGDLSGVGGVQRPGIVHRLDKDTTGLLVAAKHDEAHQNLSRQLKERHIHRVYLAIAHGAFSAASGRLEMPIGRHPVDRKRMSVRYGGRQAITLYQVLEDLGPYCLLRLDLLTGRTHQIRVHLTAIGHPLVGDRTYGHRSEDLGLQGQALHALKLEFRHPRLGEPLSFRADPPADFMSALSRARIPAGKPEDGSLPI